MFFTISETTSLFHDILCFIFRWLQSGYCIIKVHIFWEGYKILQNLHRRFVLWSNGQIYGGDFAKIFGLLRIYELQGDVKYETPCINKWLPMAFIKKCLCFGQLNSNFFFIFPFRFLIVTTFEQKEIKT